MRAHLYHAKCCTERMLILCLMQISLVQKNVSPRWRPALDVSADQPASWARCRSNQKTHTRLQSTRPQRRVLSMATLAPAHLHVHGLAYHPPGAAQPLLQDVSMLLAPGCMGLVHGRSGSGKTTLLQALAGLVQPTAGTISFQGPMEGADVAGHPDRRLASAGLVFQFPERHFLGTTLIQELTFPFNGALVRGATQLHVQRLLHAVGLSHIHPDTPVAQLSDGYKRRVALAVQLVRQPSLLLLDEPLAGLDWQRRSDLLKILGMIKKTSTVLVVSHDIREMTSLVDSAWQMLPGGRLVSDVS